MSVRYTNALKRSRLTAALVAAIVMPVAGTTFAQEATTPPPAQQTQQATSTLDKVTVTGSRIKKAEVEGPAPVVVLTADDIEKEGFSTVYEALNTLNQFTGSVQNETTQSGFTPNAQFINLRGLGPGYTLILINGKRMADYPVPYNSQSNAVSLGSIPAAAVSRIEVLTGGASAIYGSDAVAGVINIITKENYEGDSVRLRGGTTTMGGGDTGLFQWTGGKTGDNWSITYAAEYLNREGILGSQREDRDSYYDNPAFQGRPEFATATSGVYLYRNTGAAYNWLTPGGTLSTSVDALRYSCSRTSSEFEPYNTSATVSNATPNRCGYFGYPATSALQNSYNKTSAYVSGTYDFDNGMQLYGQFLGTDSQNTGVSSTQFWQTPGWVYTPAYGYIQAQRIITPEEIGGAQKTEYDEKSYNFFAGVRGTFLENRFDWDFGVSYSRFEFESNRPRFLQNRVNEYFLGTQTGVQGTYPRYDGYNLTYLNRLFSPMTPETYRSLSTIVNSTGESENSTASFSLSGDLFDLPAGSLGAALVVEAGHQEYTLTPDPRSTPAYTGADRIYNLTSTGGGGERDRYALGLEFSIPIFDSLKAQLAGRYDTYDDVTEVDGAFTWSAGLEYRPVDSLLLRGSYATSFRAPDMHYVFAGYSGAYTYITDAYLCRVAGIDPTSPSCENNTSYYYQVFRTYEGRTDLKEETSKSWTAGLVWDIMDRMSLTVDYYNMKLENQVAELDSDFLMRQYADCRLGEDVNGNPVDSTSPSCQAFLGQVTRAGGELSNGQVSQYNSYPINQASLETQGIDANWKYSLDTDRLGTFGFEVGYTHVLKLDLVRFEGDEPLNIRDHMQYFNYRSRANVRLSWSNDDWFVTTYATRMGSLPNWGETGRIAPYIRYNLDVQKKITDKLTLGFSVVNLLNNQQPDDVTFTTWPYTWRSHDVIGRQVYADVRYTF
ncbi:MAG: TonB-dependent receptor [Pseudoxanthomonas sp.]